MSHFANHVSESLRPIYEQLLTSKSEKLIAANLNLSVHVVHQRVKRIYKELAVNSRAELMAKELEASRRRLFEVYFDSAAAA